MCGVACDNLALPHLPCMTYDWRMQPRYPARWLRFEVFAALFALACVHTDAAPLPDGRYLFAATPGIRDYLEFGGHGVVVFDIDHGHRFVTRIASSGVDDKGKPVNVKGICPHAGTQRLYVCNIKSLYPIQLRTHISL